MADLTAIRNGILLALPVLLAGWQQPAAGAEAGSAGMLPDPTVPLRRGTVEGEEGAVSTDSLTLNSILIRGEERLAVINGRQVKAGDRVGNLRILSVETDHVRIEINGRERALELYSTAVRKSRKSEG